MTIPLGVTSIEDIGLLWQSGRYQFYPEETFDIDALSANNVNANGQPGLLVPLNGSHAFFMQEKRFSTRFLICERPWMSAFCIEKDSLGDPTLSDALTSLDNCRQYCQNTGHEVILGNFCTCTLKYESSLYSFPMYGRTIASASQPILLWIFSLKKTRLLESVQCNVLILTADNLASNPSCQLSTTLFHQLQRHVKT